MKIKYMPDGSKAIKRYQVFEIVNGTKLYHLAFDNQRQAEHYIKEYDKSRKFKISITYI